MKVTCVYDKLRVAVEQGERIITRNLTLPILNNLLLEAKGNILRISSTNLELGVQIEIPCKVAQEGTTSVPAKILRGVIGNLSQETIDLVANEKTISVRSGKYRGDLKCHPAEDFPIIPKPQDKNPLQLKASEFRQALSRVIPFTATSETRPEITGVYLGKTLGEETLHIASTDSFRLAEQKLEVKKEDYGREINLIIPQKAAHELLRLLEGQDEVGIIIEKNQIGFRLPNIEFVSRLIEGSYPNYENFIPKDFASEVTIGREELIQSIRLVSLVSSRINDIKVNISKKEAGIKIYSRDADLGESETFVPANISGDEVDLYFNWHYLLEGLQNIDGKKVSLSIVNEAKPALLRSADSAKYVYIVMPIRV